MADYGDTFINGFQTGMGIRRNLEETAALVRKRQQEEQAQAMWSNVTARMRQHVAGMQVLQAKQQDIANSAAAGLPYDEGDLAKTQQDLLTRQADFSQLLFDLGQELVGSGNQISAQQGLGLFEQSMQIGQSMEEQINKQRQFKADEAQRTTENQIQRGRGAAEAAANGVRPHDVDKLFGTELEDPEAKKNAGLNTDDMGQAKQLRELAKGEKDPARQALFLEEADRVEEKARRDKAEEIRKSREQDLKTGGWFGTRLGAQVTPGFDEQGNPLPPGGAQEQQQAQGGAPAAQPQGRGAPAAQGDRGSDSAALNAQAQQRAQREGFSAGSVADATPQGAGGQLPNFPNGVSMPEFMKLPSQRSEQPEEAPPAAAPAPQAAAPAPAAPAGRPHTDEIGRPIHSQHPWETPGAPAPQQPAAPAGAAGNPQTDELGRPLHRAHPWDGPGDGTPARAVEALHQQFKAFKSQALSRGENAANAASDAGHAAKSEAFAAVEKGFAALQKLFGDPAKSEAAQERTPAKSAPPAAPQKRSSSGDAAAKYEPQFAAAEQKHGLPQGLLKRVAGAESSFDPKARSKKGARGLMQIMPATAKELGVDPDDPDQAIPAAAEYLARYMKRFGSVKAALAAYNWGPGNVEKHGLKKLPAETTKYINRVMGQNGKG